MQLRARKYRARVHAEPSDFGCVALYSIQTDDFQEFLDFIYDAHKKGYSVEWKSKRKEVQVARQILSGPDYATSVTDPGSVLEQGAK